MVLLRLNWIVCVVPIPVVLPVITPETVALKRAVNRPVDPLMRTALAADVDEVLLTPNSVDCFNPKVVRAASGAHIALPIATNLAWEAIEERIIMHCEGERRVFLAEAGSPHLYFEQDLRQPFALIIGNEAHGSSQEARRLATMSISIPLANGVESLNAAMAVGIVLYEVVRQATTV